MSVLVKGMEMPIACSQCGLTYSACQMGMEVESVFDKHPNCPLVEVPTPHGRLIDADKLYPDCFSKKGQFAITQSQLANAKTVIEAEVLRDTENE